MVCSGYSRPVKEENPVHFENQLPLLLAQSGDDLGEHSLILLCMCVSVCVPHVCTSIFCTYGYMQTFVDDSDPVFMYIYMYVLYTRVCQCIHANIYTCIML